MKGRQKKMKILLVDDEPQVLAALGCLLRDTFEIVSTTDPGEAAHLLGNEEFAVVMADQRMPRMTGDALLAEARRLSGASRIMITAYPDMDVLIGALNESQICAYVKKPWDPSELMKTVEWAADQYTERRIAGAKRGEAIPEGWENRGELDVALKDAAGDAPPASPGYQGFALKSTILADDDPDDCMLFKKAWLDSGVKSNLFVVEDGDQLLNLLNQEGKSSETSASRPGLILLDLNMPRKNGFEILAEINKHPKLRSIPVVIWTTSKEESDISRAYRMGAKGYITKPVGYDEMVTLVTVIGYYWLKVVAPNPRNRQIARGMT